MKKRILILGARGMLGHNLFLFLSEKGHTVYGTISGFDITTFEFKQKALSEQIIPGIDVLSESDLIKVFIEVQPEIVINCVAVIKHSAINTNPISAITINSILPHRLEALCSDFSARFIQISTDSLFGDKKQMCTEDDKVTVSDKYSMTKVLGEVNGSNSITLRTSIIGHEIVNKSNFVEWFLSQKKVKGFSRVIYTGFPTIELSRIIEEYILPNEHLSGVYHLASNPISKYELLKLISKVYKKNIIVEQCDEPELIRSLNANRFNTATGYLPPPWTDLIINMYQNYVTNKFFINNTL